MLTDKNDKQIIKRIIFPFASISFLIIFLIVLLAIPEIVIENNDLIRNVLLIFTGTDSVEYLVSTIHKNKDKTKEEINENKAVLFSLNFLTSALALKIITLILFYIIDTSNFFLYYIISAISIILIISTVVFLPFYLVDAAREIPLEEN